jgi:hypothetical protein
MTRDPAMTDDRSMTVTRDMTAKPQRAIRCEKCGGEHWNAIDALRCSGGEPDR